MQNEVNDEVNLVVRLKNEIELMETTLATLNIDEEQHKKICKHLEIAWLYLRKYHESLLSGKNLNEPR